MIYCRFQLLEAQTRGHENSEVDLNVYIILMQRQAMLTACLSVTCLA